MHNKVTKNGGKKFTTFFYRVPDSFDVKLSKEHSDFEWVKFEDLTSKNLHPKLKLNISECLYTIKKKTSTFSEWLILKETIKYLSP